MKRKRMIFLTQLYSNIAWNNAAMIDENAPDDIGTTAKSDKLLSTAYRGNYRFVVRTTVSRVENGDIASAGRPDFETHTSALAWPAGTISHRWEILTHLTCRIVWEAAAASNSKKYARSDCLGTANLILWSMKNRLIVCRRRLPSRSAMRSWFPALLAILPDNFYS